MGSAAAEMFKPRALFFFLVVLLVCLVQTKESKTNDDDDDETIFTIQANITKYQLKIFKRLEGVEQAIVATIREGKPGLCTTCWYDERCTHDWCGPPPTTSTTTTSTTTVITPTTTDTTIPPFENNNDTTTLTTSTGFIAGK